jgi:YHS domain-containing protein
MAKDLVCGMEVEEGTNCAEYEGKRYCFCTEACRDEFLKNPSKYLEVDKENGCCN